MGYNGWNSRDWSQSHEDDIKSCNDHLADLKKAYGDELPREANCPSSGHIVYVPIFAEPMGASPIALCAEMSG